MISLVFLLVLSAVSTNGVKEGDYCIKEGVPGVCTNIKKCFDAQQDIKNRKPPTLCDFSGLEPIVCCISSGTNTERPQKGCILPPYPDHGTYVTNVPNSRPGDAYDVIIVNVTCRRGYDVDRRSRTVFCQGGWWPAEMPKCVPLCRLVLHPSVEYSCLETDGVVNVTRPCEDYEPSGTVGSPRCRSPDDLLTSHKVMNCIDGIWDHIATCTPAVSKDLDSLIKEVSESPESTTEVTVIPGRPGAVGEEYQAMTDGNPCTTVAGEKGECVPYFNCNPHYTLTQPAGCERNKVMSSYNICCPDSDRIR